MPTAPYYVNGKRVPSVSTIKGLWGDKNGMIHASWVLGTEGKNYKEEWGSKADSGSCAHAMIEMHIRGDLPHHNIDANNGKLVFNDGGKVIIYEGEILENGAKGYDNYLKWEAEKHIEFVAQEIHMVSEKYGYGGTPDAIGYVGGEFCLIDWKTSAGSRAYPDYLIQLAAYKQLWEENNDEKIQGFHLCIFSKEYGDFHHHYYAELDEAWEIFRRLTEMYPYYQRLKKRT